jgi:hypothetical protein
MSEPEEVLALVDDLLRLAEGSTATRIEVETDDFVVAVSRDAPPVIAARDRVAGAPLLCRTEDAHRGRGDPADATVAVGGRARSNGGTSGGERHCVARDREAKSSVSTSMRVAVEPSARRSRSSTSARTSSGSLIGDPAGARGATTAPVSVQEVRRSAR